MQTLQRAHSLRSAHNLVVNSSYSVRALSKLSLCERRDGILDGINESRRKSCLWQSNRHHALSTSAKPVSSTVTSPSSHATSGSRIASTTPFADEVVGDSEHQVLDFNDFEMSFRNHTLSQLLRARIIFALCSMRILVNNSEILIKIGYRVLPSTVMNTILKYTFFGHFCAGEDINEIKTSVEYLRRNGVGSILDYAAENDIEDDTSSSTLATEEHESASSTNPDFIEKVPEAIPITKVYKYQDEELCDTHAKTFETAVRAVHEVSPQGFAAIKVTALGNPLLLKRMSTAIEETKKLFKKFDTDKDGKISKKEFLRSFEKYFEGGTDRAEEAFNVLNTHNVTEEVDFNEWASIFVLENLADLTAYCKNKQGPLSQAVLNAEEMTLLDNMINRVEKLAELASDLDVKLMIDAEHTYFQPAIDYITTRLAQKYNMGDKTIIYNTYQMYLLDSQERLQQSVEKSKREGFRFACKLVRGAYMQLEREYSKVNDMEDPIHRKIEDTHANYDRGVEFLLNEIQQGVDVELMLATHNQVSIEKALDNMAQKKIGKEYVYFGQLLGMSDQLTFSLGNESYRAYKYVPYGKVEEVMPYLIRRAQENADMMNSTQHEARLISKEILRRLNIGK